MEGYDPAAGLFETSGSGGPCSKIQLYISCRKLKDLDYIGKSDPYCQVWLKNDERSSWAMVGKTETIQNNLNPVFSTPITIDYYFEKNQEIKFEVLDEDSSRSEAQGSLSTLVGNLVGSKNQTYCDNLVYNFKKSKNGKIIIKTDTVKESNFYAKMGVRAMGLKSKKSMGFFKSNHPFLVIKRTLHYDDKDPDNAVKIFTSEIRDKTLNPSWTTINMKLQDL